ncbi:Molecular chaperone DnaJ OS=Dyella jiangningensis GN=CH75_06260 PE=4 SV=1: DnaJ [Gemmataceae bacterium]|nr:Molecular chaperone DnaJ OS=Dyella jiangningensis GN=CH75_06260 PE=4 SV=1: DnaJ [Gemmataceae bacterium]VTU01019.1 Molecular chaperone DnaJ OS=Dyella jiangningensis GN=CH75_06260 PE=4 SV=1: DnaJ [Gemmataceae bacterium]
MPDATRFPLSWPTGRSRTASHRRQRPKFTAPTFGRARDDLLAELRRLGATNVILSTNVECRQDGLPYAGRRTPDDPGVAVYFARKGKDLALCCDRWTSVEDNLRAITDAVECIRTIERRGTGEMVDAAFLGFQALPAARAKKPWWEVLQAATHWPTNTIEDCYRSLSKQYHPDRNPGDAAALERYHEVQDAYAAFKNERGL